MFDFLKKNKKEEREKEFKEYMIKTITIIYNSTGRTLTQKKLNELKKKLKLDMVGVDND